MAYRFFLLALLTVSSVLGAPVASAEGPKLLDFSLSFNPIDYVIGRVIDELIDYAGDKRLEQSMAMMDQRLKAMERDAALKSEQREAIRKLRTEIKQCATKAELKKVLVLFRGELKTIRQRLDRVEERVEFLSVRLEDVEKKTEKADDPQHFLNRGERALSYKENFRALANARLASKLSEKKPAGFLLQGKIYERMGSSLAARACFDHAVNLDDKHAESFRLRADLRWKLKDYAGADSDYSAALKLEPKDVWSWGHRAAARIALDQDATAVADATEALKLDPDDTFARFHRGRGWIKTGFPKKAVADFDLFIKALPDDPDGYDRRGLAWHLDKDHDKAMADLKQALKLDPDHAFAHLHISRLLNAQNQYKKALPYAKRAVELNPGHYVAHFDYALALHSAGKSDDALKQYLLSAYGNPKNQSDFRYLSFVNRGVIYFSRKEYSKATVDLTRALGHRKDGKTGSGRPVIGIRADCYRYLGKHSLAVSDATKALQVSPKDRLSLFARAFSNAQLKKDREAVADYDSYLKLFPTSAVALSNRGLSHERLGLRKDALADYTKAITLNPKYTFAWTNRALLYRKMGEKKKAADDFEDVLSLTTGDDRDRIIFQLVELRPDSKVLLRALPSQADGKGQYSGLLRRLYVPDDKKSYGSYKDYGSSSTTSYRGYKNIPKGYWVYVAPYWYVWKRK